MSVQRIEAEQAIHTLADFDALIDARSESEFALDHLPSAINWPSLHDEERARVGTLHQQSSAFDARKLGAALVSNNISMHLAREAQDKPIDWRPLIYCWRGGQRSGALATVLGQIGFRVTVIDGGYKAFRRAMRAALAQQVERLDMRIICGPTGSGKTRLLHALDAAGAQVLDLEALARHRASVLGLIPGTPQPSQKHFEMRIWAALRKIYASRPVYVEAESRKVGNVTIPEALIHRMRASACLRLDLSFDERVALLMEDYPFFVEQPDFFSERLQTLTTLRGHERVARWQEWITQGQIEAVVRELLTQHYDPGYLRSTQRNFEQFTSARVIELPDRSNTSMADAARAIIQLEKTVSR